MCLLLELVAKTKSELEKQRFPLYFGWFQDSKVSFFSDPFPLECKAGSEHGEWGQLASLLKIQLFVIIPLYSYYQFIIIQNAETIGSCKLTRMEKF